MTQASLPPRMGQLCPPFLQRNSTSGLSCLEDPPGICQELRPHSTFSFCSTPSPQRYFSCFWTWLCLFSFLLLHFNSYCHVFRVQEKLQNATSPYHFNWKSPPIISGNPSLALKNTTLGFLSPLWWLSFFLWIPPLYSPIKWVGLLGLHSPLTLW